MQLFNATDTYIMHTPYNCKLYNLVVVSACCLCKDEQIHMDAFRQEMCKTEAHACKYQILPTLCRCLLKITPTVG